MKQSMTVGMLRRALEGVKDNLPVYLDIPSLCKPGMPDSDYYTKDAKIRPSSGISNTHFSIVAGEGFGW